MKPKPQKTFHFLIVLSIIVTVYIINIANKSTANASGIEVITIVTSTTTQTPSETLEITLTATTTSTSVMTSTVTATETSTPTPTSTITPTETPKPSNTSTNTPTATSTPTIPLTSTPTPTSTIGGYYLPFFLRQPSSTPTPTETTPPIVNIQQLLYCQTQPLLIPDNDPSGVNSTIVIPDNRYLVDVNVRINVSHTWVGDLTFNLTHLETGKYINLIDRPGYPADVNGCSGNDIIAILDDELTASVETRCNNFIPTISGIYTPNQPLATFRGDVAAGNWNLTIADNFQNDSGQLNSWCLVASVNDTPVLPTPTPVIDPPPAQASVGTISGRPQGLPLDCESRSAVDWAGFFGTYVGEYEFFNSLPVSDDPDTGFVGYVYGTWGQIPPSDYGVHAVPIANRLNAYGLSAYAQRPLSYPRLQHEIAIHHPVIAWIIGDHTYPYEHTLDPGIPTYYIPTDGALTVVSPYEHTVIITGYTTNTVSYLDGGTIYTIWLDQFLNSWSALGNMAVTSDP
jgi:subtilisin-like proprotein convertase family protein/uncharacterized protein YvpB